VETALADPEYFESKRRDYKWPLFCDFDLDACFTKLSMKKWRVPSELQSGA
jgi:hypothetical protein